MGIYKQVQAPFYGIPGAPALTVRIKPPSQGSGFPRRSTSQVVHELQRSCTFDVDAKTGTLRQ